MIPVRDLSSEDRDRVRKGFVARMACATTPEWRKLWETEVLFLDGRNDEAVAQLRELANTAVQDVAVAALMSLGEWYEESNAIALAQQVYMKAVETAGTPAPVRPVVKLARLHNRAHEPALAASLLQDVATAIEKLPADVVQFVVVEYCQSLRDLGRVDDARMFIRDAIRSFPDRAELLMLEQHLFPVAE